VNENRMVGATKKNDAVMNENRKNRMTR